MFIPLHVKSDYSLGYGTDCVDELVSEAARLGYPALALTDIENLYGQVRFHHQCRLHGIRPITGIELRPGFDGRRSVGQRNGRLLLLAADESGYRSLCRIVGRRRGAIRDAEAGSIPSDPLQLAARFSEGLFALSDDPSMVERLVGCGSFPPGRLGMLLIRPDDPALDALRRQVAARLGVRPVADLDALFLHEGDRQLHLLQLAIRQGKKLAEESGAESVERRLRSPAEAAALFADLPDAVAAAQEIAAACRFDIRTIAQGSPGFDLPGERAADKLRKLCEEGILDLVSIGRWNDAYRRRLEKELSLFERLGFSGFMTAVAEIIAHCRKEGIPVAVRGSAVSSLVLHLLGGSSVDPVAHGLLFERFLHPGKTAWPDVDIDLPWHRRDEVIGWVFERFGRNRVAMVATHHTFQYRSALREGLKTWGARPTLIEQLSAALPPEELAIEDVDFLGLAKAVRDDPLSELGSEGEGAELSAVLPLVRRLIGKPRHIAVHPGGIVVGQPPLEDMLPLELAPKGVVVTQYDLVAVARLGLVKIDLLGNRCLSELEEALALAGSEKGLATIPAEDPQTLALIDRGETIGCFQFESPAMRSLLARLPIRRQSDLIAALALIRPGAASGEVKSAFVSRARGEEADTNPFPMLADRLNETHGLFLYEEDIMALLSRVGGMSLEDADELRREILSSGGNRELLASLEADFLQRAKSGGADASLAQRAWTTAARFAAYSFNKAHAASYALLAYYSAYVKAHHPLEFACALLNHHQGLYPLRIEAGELTRMGVSLRPPHVNLSDYPSRIEENGAGKSTGAVRVGLDKIKGLSHRGALGIIAERSDRGRFVSLRGFLERVRLSRGEVSALVLCGACDGLPPLSAAAYPFAHEAVLERLRQGCDPAELDFLRIPVPEADTEQVRLYRGLVRVKNELRYLEMHLSAHPVALLRPEAKRYGCLTVRRTLLLPDGSTVRLAVVIAAMRRVATWQGAMQFLTLEDETGLLEAAVLPPVYRALGERVATPGPFLVEGTLRQQQGAVHLEVRLLAPFHKRRRPFGSDKQQG